MQGLAYSAIAIAEAAEIDGFGSKTGKIA